MDLYSKKVKLRSQQTSFDWKSNCFLCGRDAIVDTRHPDRNDVQIVATILSTTVDISTKKRTTFREKILNICMHRSDFWASQVESQLQNCIDLVAEEAVYHKSCYCKFTSYKSLGNSENKVVGRPENKDMLAISTKLCEWLESEAELYTLSELHQKMKDLSGGKEVYTVKRLKQKLQEHYKEFIFFAEVQGRANVVCFRNMVDFLINET